MPPKKNTSKAKVAAIPKAKSKPSAKTKATPTKKGKIEKDQQGKEKPKPSTRGLIQDVSLIYAAFIARSVCSVSPDRYKRPPLEFNMETETCKGKSELVTERKESIEYREINANLAINATLLEYLSATDHLSSTDYQIRDYEHLRITLKEEGQSFPADIVNQLRPHRLNILNDFILQNNEVVVDYNNIMNHSFMSPNTTG